MPATNAGRNPRSFRFGDAFDGDRDRRDLAADFGLELLGHVLVRAQEFLRLLAALAKAGLAVPEPRAGLADDVRRYADVQQAALAADALAVHDVELRYAERRGDLVLHDLHADARPDGVRAALDRLDAPNV